MPDILRTLRDQGLAYVGHEPCPVFVRSMSASWHVPGQMVVCLDPFEWFVPIARRLPGLHERDVYTIRCVRLVIGAEVSPVLLRLDEIGAASFWYPAQRFKPIARPSIHAIRAAAGVLPLLHRSALWPGI